MNTGKYFMESTKENYNLLLIKNNISIVVYDIGFFQIKDIFLSDTKKNIIMDGKFTKIIYSDELITTHGIFLKIPFYPVGKPEPPPITVLSKCSGQKNTMPQQCTSTVRPQAEEKSGELAPAVGTAGPVDNSHHKNKDNTNDVSNAKYKQIYKLQSHDILNSKNITDIIRIEIQILEFYKQLFQCKKKIVFMLKEQLQEGNIKLYKEHFYNYINFSYKQTPNIPNVILKISGIWETEDNIGLTYKFIEYTLDHSRIIT
jgi:hypothetical protein